jgi:LacI family transcriptional regulator
LVGRHPTDTRVNYVDADNINGARQATRHLLRLGRTRIGLISGPQNMIAGVDRLTGHSQALHERGLAVEPELVVSGGFSESGGYLAMQQMLASRPDAIFAASDAMAMGALRALREAGLRVPEDVALVGFDDLPFAARAEPPLTTVRQPTHRMGAMTVETLIELMEQPASSPYHLILPTELVVRASCGAMQKLT